MSEVRPWDLINPNNHEKNKDEVERRFNICKSCEWFRPNTETCRKCGCFMKLKTKLEKAHCPIHKW